MRAGPSAPRRREQLPLLERQGLKRFEAALPLERARLQRRLGRPLTLRQRSLELLGRANDPVAGRAGYGGDERAHPIVPPQPLPRPSAPAIHVAGGLRSKTEPADNFMGELLTPDRVGLPNMAEQDALDHLSELEGHIVNRLNRRGTGL